MGLAPPLAVAARFEMSKRNKMNRRTVCGGSVWCEQQKGGTLDPGLEDRPE